ncbi:FGGY-family carbohydrate kinase [Pseudolysinimonas yzui]|uniref:Sugar kinase n=1 Tax=Pseudolysinimonas yzui TaxID=2708254 RepID=A0A8J3M1Y7_9MICO|nr:FGGY family carbohydrate kinase [Pseudolysinimonas yzui]GHF22971.1 sugar kinase [Pseudolysinimonas yzui]
MSDAVLGVDVGTSSTKGVLVGLDGVVIASAIREHEVWRPNPGWAEMPAELWWQELTSIARELTGEHRVRAVGVSGMGPCVVLTDAEGIPLRPAILYGVDTRAIEQIARMTAELGDDQIVARGGSTLSTQAAGPKIAWVAENEPDVFARARRLFMPASFLAFRLTGEYVLDHQSASQCNPLYDSAALAWYRPWSDRVMGGIPLPRLVWADTVVGGVTARAAAATGLPEGIPVVAGTIDAWTEAVSVGAQNPGDLMLMYGTTMFLVNTVAERASAPGLWGTVGAFEGTYSLAGGMATSGAITGWLRELFGRPDYPSLLAEAAASAPGANGVLMLPYFAGERTPIADPDARGMIVGLTLSHTRGDLYRAALEATALGVRHNIEAFRAGGGTIDRVVAVGGGTQGDLWTQIVSDVTGLTQVVCATTIGASFGAAYLAASSIADVHIDAWNPVERIVRPRAELRDVYAERYELYRRLYPATMSIAHALALNPTAP